jgi:mRNA interferase YafQ
MRRIERTTQFKRDYKLQKKGRYRAELDSALVQIIELLIADKDLPVRCFDHPLIGQWKDFRDCHIRPDLVLIYEKLDPEILRLVRLGSHSDLGL